MYIFTIPDKWSRRRIFFYEFTNFLTSTSTICWWLIQISSCQLSMIYFNRVNIITYTIFPHVQLRVVVFSIFQYSIEMSTEVLIMLKLSRIILRRVLNLNNIIFVILVNSAFTVMNSSIYKVYYFHRTILYVDVFLIRNISLALT